MGDLQSFEATLARVREAVDATYRGDAEPYTQLWSSREPVSLFGALGPRKTNRPDIEQAFRWVASRFSDPAMVTDFEVVEVSDSFAYTVGYERGELAIDGKKQHVRVRVTQIFRHENNEWKMVHRHGDFAPVDDSPGAETQAGGAGEGAVR
jgi:ketosteroid isomerase-like protein